MKKLSLMVLMLMFAMSFASYAQMTDDQVVAYVKTAVAAGKSESQVGKELIAKGVTQAQAERIKTKYEATSTNANSVTEQAVGHGVVTRTTAAETVDNGAGMMDAATTQIADPTTGKGVQIFGHNIFNGRTLTFEPNENAATPENYKLGPGDEVQIEIWGYNEASINQTITPEGKIFISQIGPVQLSGLTIREASEKIRKVLVSKYASIGGDQPNTSVSVTLGQVRTIQVNIMGEVTTPGTYRLSSFATVFHAIYRAGGVKPTGSLRAIKVIRGGREFAKVDVYGYLFEGKSESDVNLQEGDVIIVPPYLRLVNISGNVKRPMSYELNGSETLSTLINYAGGFTSDAYTRDIRVVRQTGGAERQVYTVKQSDFSSYKMADGDVVTVGASLDRFSNKVEVRGFVFRPGMYELGSEISTVGQLIGKAGGLTEDAFLPRAIIVREKDDLSLENLSVNIGGILKGGTPDVALRKNDILIISSIHELQDPGTLTINGYVASPGVFPYADNTTVEDLILKAGGLLDGASLARVDVARRVGDPGSTMPSDTVGMTYSFAIKDGFAIDGGDKFTLKPYDVVSVRKSPAYQKQTFVTISGRVAFPGTYVLLKENERLSDLIARAGGVTPHAYVKGARLMRVPSAESAFLDNEIKSKVGTGIGRDSVAVSKLDVNGSYNVAVNLEKSLSSPGSAEDVILQEGDNVVIPQEDNTVKVMGEVLFPNAVVYRKGMTLGKYIDAAGGYTDMAKKSKVYIVYQSGRAHKGSVLGAEIEPGCAIIVPSKKENKTLSTAELLAVASSAASLTTMTSTLFNLFK